jgi:hypothetical protein
MLGHGSDKTIRKYLNNITKKDRLLQGHVVLAKNPNDAAILTQLAAVLDSDEADKMRGLLTNILGPDSA